MANILLLFCVAIEPFLYNLLQTSVTGVETSAFLATASIFFALDVGGMFLMLGLFCDEIATEDRKLVSKDLIGSFKVERNNWFVSAALFLSVIPVFWSIQIGGTPVRIWLWIAPLILNFAERRYNAIRSKKRPKGPTLNTIFPLS